VHANEDGARRIGIAHDDGDLIAQHRPAAEYDEACIRGFGQRHLRPRDDFPARADRVSAAISPARGRGDRSRPAFSCRSRTRDEGGRKKQRMFAQLDADGRHGIRRCQFTDATTSRPVAKRPIAALVGPAIARATVHRPPGPNPRANLGQDQNAVAKRANASSTEGAMASKAP